MVLTGVRDAHLLYLLDAVGSQEKQGNDVIYNGQSPRKSRDGEGWGEERGRRISWKRWGRRSSRFVCLFGFLTSSSTTRLYRGRAPRQERLTILHAATHETELGDHDFCLSRSHYTDTDPTSRERAAMLTLETNQPNKEANKTCELQGLNCWSQSICLNMPTGIYDV